MTTTKPQTRPAASIREAMRILGVDEASVAALVEVGQLTEMYTRPTSGEPEAIYNVTELEALAKVQQMGAALEKARRVADALAGGELIMAALDAEVNV